MLQGGSVDNKEDGGPQFAEVFVIIWFGSIIITLNSKLLGGTMYVTLCSFDDVHCCNLNIEPSSKHISADGFTALTWL